MVDEPNATLVVSGVFCVTFATLISSPMIAQVAANSDFVVKPMTHGTLFLWNSIVTTSGFPSLCSFMRV